jgi:hypothetical protein
MKKSFLSITRMLSIIFLPFGIFYNIFININLVYMLGALVNKPSASFNYILNFVVSFSLTILLPIFLIHFTGKKIKEIESSAIQGQVPNQDVPNVNKSKLISLPIIILLGLICSFIVFYFFLVIAMGGAKGLKFGILELLHLAF